MEFMDGIKNKIKIIKIFLMNLTDDTKSSIKSKATWGQVLEEYLYENVPTLILFIVCHNSLMWLLEVTLGWDSAFWSTQWTQLVDRYPYPVHLYSGGGLVVTLTVYWGWGGFLCLMDRTGWLSRYKVQPGTNEPPENAKFIKV